MSYDLSIGDLRRDSNGEIFTPIIRDRNAPADSVPTDHTNQRWPSYSGWIEFIHDTGLDDLFNTLMPTHPGVGKITEEAKKRLDEVYLKKDSLPKNHHGRLEWLKYWIDWALVNCKNPVFINN